MKRFVALFVLMLSICQAWALQVTVKSFQLRPSDLAARENVRTDAKGTDCAMIRVQVVGINDLQFEEAVGKTNYGHGEYMVYVPQGLKTLTFSSKEKDIRQTVDIDKFGIDVESRKAYLLQLETDSRLRSAVFVVSPTTAVLKIDNDVLALDSTGEGDVTLHIGTYKYSVEAKGYKPQNGTIELTDDKISTMTYVNLDPITFPVKINCGTDSASVFVDNVAYGITTPENMTMTLQLPNGKHNLRIIKPRYKEIEDNFKVDNSELTLDKLLKQRHLKTVRHTEERSHTSVNLRNCWYFMIGGDKFDKDKNDGYSYGGHLSFLFLNHFWGIAALNWGLNFGLDGMSKKSRQAYNATVDDDEHIGDVGMFFDVPLQLGLSFPFGKYNRHLVSFLGGGYGKYSFNLGKGDNNSSDEGGMPDYWDYGLRGTFRIDFSEFSFDSNISQSLNKKGLFFSINIGYKIYK